MANEEAKKRYKIYFKNKMPIKKMKGNKSSQ